MEQRGAARLAQTSVCGTPVFCLKAGEYPGPWLARQCLVLSRIAARTAGLVTSPIGMCHARLTGAFLVSRRFL